ncbi:MAG: thiamine pyrophosphate-dependent dehydrogenase E1 component subunit alpha [Anaerolineae bacterium]
MVTDLWSLYALMLKSRLFEEAVTKLWNDGLISGEMHLGTGEEAIIAGVVSHLGPDDAIALDHRGSAAMLMRGVDPVLLLREILGHPGGLSGGKGGHMHLFSKEHLTASSGIVGAAGPSAVGFAMAAQYLHPGAIAVAFFGEGAMNQGMLMESLNLASVWNLPVLFVCKDDSWAIVTRPGESTGGTMGDRVRGLGVHYQQVEGLDVKQVSQAVHQAIDRLRQGSGPIFLHARCVHLEGHLLGLLLLRATRRPFRELPRISIPLIRAFFRPGAKLLRERLAGTFYIISTITDTLRDPRRSASNDPVARARILLQSDPDRLHKLEESIEAEITACVTSSLQEAAP